MVAVVKWSTRRIVAPLFEGSNPSSHPINFILLGRSQVGKAPDFDSGMRWFESSRPSHFDPLAQSVEHLTFNQGVVGSSPTWVTSKNSAFQVRLKGFFFIGAEALLTARTKTDLFASAFVRKPRHSPHYACVFFRA